MNVAAVREAYRASDCEELDPDQFRLASLSYAQTHPNAAHEAARLYCSLGEGRAERPPIGDEHYVAGLFELGLRQPPASQVSRVTSMAVGIATIPQNQLGKMAAEEQYLVLHAAAELAQGFGADLARSLVRDHGEFRASRRRWPSPFGWMMLLSIGATLMFVFL